MQQSVAQRLDDLAEQLIQGRSGGGLLSSLKRRWQPTPVVQGLYLWGSVGRGKTMLMDLFHDSLPEGMGVRMHFHRFMYRVHAALTELSGTAEPLSVVAADLAAQGQVLCFDEFFVSDIGDAMILGELLRHLFERGVTLVATSNVVPSKLYDNGLQRRRFLPAIALLEEHTAIYHLDSELDHRLRVLSQAEIYHLPLDGQAHELMAQNFHNLVPHQNIDQVLAQEPVVLTIEGRPLLAKALADDVVWFDFAEICLGPRSANDYIELSREFHAVLISGVEQMGPREEDAARRFISLVDEFYERNVKLILSAAVPVLELYVGERLRFEFERTQSRLIEMQSQDYLARVHLA